MRKRSFSETAGSAKQKYSSAIQKALKFLFDFIAYHNRFIQKNHPRLYVVTVLYIIIAHKLFFVIILKYDFFENLYFFILYCSNAFCVI